MFLPLRNKLLKKSKSSTFHLHLRWSSKDTNQFAQVLREEKNNPTYEVIKLTSQQAAGMLLIYYTKPKSSDSP